MADRRFTASAGACGRCGSTDTYEAGDHTMHPGKFVCRACATRQKRRQRKRMRDARLTTIHDMGGIIDREQDPIDWEHQYLEPPLAPLPSHTELTHTLARLHNNELRTLFQRTHWSQQDIAREIATSQSTIGRWMTHQSRPQRLYLIRLHNLVAAIEDDIAEHGHLAALHGLGDGIDGYETWQRLTKTNRRPCQGLTGGCTKCRAWTERYARATLEWHDAGELDQPAQPPAHP